MGACLSSKNDNFEIVQLKGAPLEVEDPHLCNGEGSYELDQLSNINNDEDIKIIMPDHERSQSNSIDVCCMLCMLYTLCQYRYFYMDCIQTLHSSNIFQVPKISMLTKY